jgi:hypothetical protein
MSEAESIQSILGESPFVTGESPAPPAVETKTEAPAEIKPEVVESKPDRTRDESGKFAKAEEKPAEKPAEKPKLSSAEVAAIIDERRKRQDAEQKYADLLAKTQKPGEKPSVFENEDAAISARVTEGTRGLRESMYKLSVKAARGIYKDFADAENAFAEAMERDPRLIVGLQQSDDPGEYIYTMGIHVRELADVGGDLMKYREKVSAVSQSKIDEQAKQIAALNSELETLKKSQAELAAVPRSLNGLPSTPAKAGDGDPDDIRSIVRFK